MKLDQNQRVVAPNGNVGHYEGNSLEGIHPSSPRLSDKEDISNNARISHEYHQSGDTNASHFLDNMGPNIQAPTQSQSPPALGATKPHAKDISRVWTPSFNRMHGQASANHVGQFKENSTPMVRSRERGNVGRGATERVVTNRQLDETEGEGGSHCPQLLTEQCPHFSPPTAAYQGSSPANFQHAFHSRDSSWGSSFLSENFPIMDEGGSCLCSPRHQFCAEEDMNRQYPGGMTFSNRIDGHGITPLFSITRNPRRSGAFWTLCDLNSREPETDIPSDARMVSWANIPVKLEYVNCFDGK